MLEMWNPNSLWTHMLLIYSDVSEDEDTLTEVRIDSRKYEMYIYGLLTGS